MLTDCMWGIQNNGCLDLVEWNTGIEYWTGILPILNPATRISSFFLTLILFVCMDPLSRDFGHGVQTLHCSLNVL